LLLFWRNLALFYLLNSPEMQDRSIRTHYAETEWVDGGEEKRRLEAWKTGMAGYPLVRHGMDNAGIRMMDASLFTEYQRVNWMKGCE
jgi:deoxyribodipyrimidine photolyase